MNVETIFGHITAMHRVTAGHHFTAAAGVGATVLTLDDTADFDEAGGQVLVSGQVYDYDEVDRDASTITVPAGLTVAAAVDDPAELFDPEVGGTIVVEYEADVLLDDQDPSDRPIQVSVPHGLVPMLEESVRGGIAEAVSLVRDGEHDWTIWQVEGKLAVNLIADEAVAAAADAFSLAEDAMTAAEFAQATADGKINTFYQTTAPTTDMGVGDLWFDTDDHQAYRYNGTSWVSVQDQAIVNALAAAESAQVTADGKIVHYVMATAPSSTTYDLGYGDIWTNTSMDNRRYYWDGDSWEPLIAGNQAFADEFVGKTFTATTGGQFRTSSGADGIKINGSGFFGYNSSGTLKTFISPVSGLIETWGTLNAYGGASFGGYFYVGSGATVDGGLTVASGELDASTGQFTGLLTTASLTVSGATTLSGNVSGFHAVGDITCDTQVKGAKLFATAADTTGSTGGDDVRIGTEGQLKRVTSAERYKKFIRPAEIDPRAVLALEPVSYEYRATCRPEEYVAGQRDFGFIADWADALGLCAWVGRGVDDQIETFRYGSFIVAEHVALRFVDGRVTTIEDQVVPDILARLNALEAA